MEGLWGIKFLICLGYIRRPDNLRYSKCTGTVSNFFFKHRKLLCLFFVIAMITSVTYLLPSCSAKPIRSPSVPLM